MLLQDADLILLDEPFAAIDAQTAADLMAVIARWRAEQRTVVAVLHDLDQVRSDFPSTLLLARDGDRLGPDRRACSPPTTCCAPGAWPRPGTSMRRPVPAAACTPA